MKPKFAIGDLIIVLVNVELVDGTVLKSGDIGIILKNDYVGIEHYFTDFDYVIHVNGALVYVFEDEIEPYV